MIEQPIEWRRVFVWLNRGYQVAEIAQFYDISGPILGRLARRQLPPKAYARFQTLATINRNRNYEEHIHASKKRLAEHREREAERARRRRKRARPDKEKFKTLARLTNGGNRFPTVHRDLCGTSWGYRRHEYYWEESCAPCRKAIRVVQNRYRAKRKKLKREQAQAEAQQRRDHGQAGERRASVAEGEAGHPDRG